MVCKHGVHTQSCPTHCNPVDCSPPGSSVHGTLQARILEIVAISLPGDLPDPGTEPLSLSPPALAGRSFTKWATRIRLQSVLTNTSLQNKVLSQQLLAEPQPPSPSGPGGARMLQDLEASLTPGTPRQAFHQKTPSLCSAC